ncbi:hypothetical protein ANN_26962 [Periplaneta americana]|uniref:Uncharacterized protein n=1 Tax=Periplaneta americana TaxID=6978 RepID=A0ABQ8RWU6_PERAM|nr:hypothetical protein ANN_26962 [Periplaneta americana]
MSPGSKTESYPAFARIGLRETPEKTSTRILSRKFKSKGFGDRGYGRKREGLANENEKVYKEASGWKKKTIRSEGLTTQGMSDTASSGKVEADTYDVIERKKAWLQISSSSPCKQQLLKTADNSGRDKMMSQLTAGRVSHKKQVKKLGKEKQIRHSTPVDCGWGTNAFRMLSTPLSPVLDSPLNFELRSPNCGPLHSNSGLRSLTQLRTHSSRSPVSKLALLLHKTGWLAVQRLQQQLLAQLPLFLYNQTIVSREYDTGNLYGCPEDGTSRILWISPLTAAVAISPLLSTPQHMPQEADARATSAPNHGRLCPPSAGREIVENKVIETIEERRLKWFGHVKTISNGRILEDIAGVDCGGKEKKKKIKRTMDG